MLASSLRTYQTSTVLKWDRSFSLIAASIVGLVAAWMLAHLIDFPLARLIYQAEGGQWSLRDNVLLEPVLHVGGRWLSALAWLAVLGVTVHSWRRESRVEWTRAAARMLLAVLLSTLLVSRLKAATHMDCPWDLTEFGGLRPYVALFAPRSISLGTPSCFPAGQACGGYAWVAAYFFFAAVRPQWRRAGLSVGVIAGAVFGIAQQLRGAHFLSHDIATLTICWTVACAVEGGHRWRMRRMRRETRA